MAEFMRNTDAFTWAMESDPRLRSTVVTVAVLDRPPDWDEVRRRFDLVSRKVPTFRQRVIASPPPAPPRWEYDPHFDLDYHIRRVGAAEPRTLGAVVEMARLALMQDFDRARALWEMTLIDGLENGGAAVVCKFHHALTDGIGGVKIATALFDDADGQYCDELLPSKPAASASTTSRLAVYRDMWRAGSGFVGAALLRALRSAPWSMYKSARRPITTARSAAATATSAYRTVRPITRAGSALIKDRGLIRRLGVHEVPMPALRAAAHRCGGALNDAFVAGVAGGLRRYHEKHGITVGDLHLTMPISLRTKTDEAGGNRITLMRFDVPTSEADPAKRITAIRERTGAVRREKSLPYTQFLAGILNLVPRWYIGSVLRHVDFVASNVPGVPAPVFLGGAAVRNQYAFGPTTGAAVNVTLLTYVDRCALGINVDASAIPDYDVFHECLVAGFDEVLALAS